MLVTATIEQCRPMFRSGNVFVHEVLQTVAETFGKAPEQADICEVFSSACNRKFSELHETQCYMALEESNQFTPKQVPMWTSFTSAFEADGWHFEVTFTFHLIGHMTVELVARRYFNEAR